MKHFHDTLRTILSSPIIPNVLRVLTLLAALDGSTPEQRADILRAIADVFREWRL